MRDQERFLSQLPEFELARVPVNMAGVHSGLFVRCPRKACREWFIVKLKWHKHRTRCCPHCLKTAKIPRKMPPR